MGNFHQHLKFSSTLGVSYASLTWLLIGIDWLYGSIALLFSMLGGMLPDLDSDSGKEIKHLSSITSVFSALLFWAASGKVAPPLAFEIRIWITLISAWFSSYAVRWFLGKVSVHRGMFHSIPTCFIWGSIMYLYYPHQNHWVRVYMASGIMVGYMSHLLCDEYFSVESFAGLRVNKAFGTAMKFWSGSLFSTLLCYIILGICVKQVSEKWPRTRDGTYVAIGHPSESIDHITATAKTRLEGHATFVKQHGFLAWLKELVSAANAQAELKVELVKANGLTREGLKTSLLEIKNDTKSTNQFNDSLSAVKQIAVEAKSTVTDQVQVDSAANVNRPLLSHNTEPELLTEPEEKASDTASKNVEGSISRGIQAASQKLTSIATDASKTGAKTGTTKKQFQMEVYQPRKRTFAPSNDETGNVARKYLNKEQIRIR